MMKYERIREIFNSCGNSQMRDVDIQEIEIDDIEADIRQFCAGKNVTVEKFGQDGGAVIYNISTDGLNQRISYMEIEPLPKLG
ncbi:MAG: hypothetical protein LBD48_06950 [Treponema sp.]|nr:hypothetical protein [Treponema sp.]